METLGEIHSAGGYAWDEIDDPEEEIRRIRTL